MTRRQALHIARTPVTWILVADGKQAQVYARKQVEKLVSAENWARHNLFAEGLATAPVPVDGMQWAAESIRQYDIAPNKLGRVQESVGSARHMAEPRLDAHEEIREHFARTVAEALNKAQAKKHFDRLVLVAAPDMLGRLKKHLSAKALKSVAAEMPKDLTHYEGEALAEHLEGIA